MSPPLHPIRPYAKCDFATFRKLSAVFTIQPAVLQLSMKVASHEDALLR